MTRPATSDRARSSSASASELEPVACLLEFHVLAGEGAARFELVEARPPQGATRPPADCGGGDGTERQHERQRAEDQPPPGVAGGTSALGERIQLRDEEERLAVLAG